MRSATAPEVPKRSADGIANRDFSDGGPRVRIHLPPTGSRANFRFLQPVVARGNLGWRTIFFVNAPIGLALMGAALRLIPSIPTKPGARLDLMGAIVLLVALLCLIGPLLLGADLGWSPSLFAVVAAGLGLLALMWPLERWVEHHRKGLCLGREWLIC